MTQKVRTAPPAIAARRPPAERRPRPGRPRAEADRLRRAIARPGPRRPRGRRRRAAVRRPRDDQQPGGKSGSFTAMYITCGQGKKSNMLCL